MKKFFNLAAACLVAVFFSNCSTTAQSQNKAADEAALLKMWDNVWADYDSDNEEKMWAYYSETATEIYPDGTSMSGKKAIKAGYEAFKGMLEGKPSWSTTKPTIQWLGTDAALLISDITSDIKLKGGQQIGGKMKFATVAVCRDGKWFIEFDSQTPVLPPMPGMEAKN